MLKNYFKIACRNLKKQRAFSLINIIGLGISLTFFILLISYVQDELNFDRFHEKADSIHMLTVSLGSLPPTIGANPIIGEALQSEFPEIRRTVRFWSPVATRAITTAASIRR